jgi:hypothetical protein
MTVADLTLAAFTICNSLRVLAYLPQISRAATDQSGAQAISFATWSLFLFSNVSAVAYALVNKDDWTMAVLFLANAVGCSAILLIGAWKRSQYRHRQAETASADRSILGVVSEPRSGTATILAFSRRHRSGRPSRGA